MRDVQSGGDYISRARPNNQDGLVVEPNYPDTGTDYDLGGIGDSDISADFSWVDSSSNDLFNSIDTAYAPKGTVGHDIGAGWKNSAGPNESCVMEGRMKDKDGNVVPVTLTEVLGVDGKTDHFIMASADYSVYEEVDAKTGWDMIAKPVPDIDKGSDFKDKDAVIDYLAKNPNSGLFANGASYTADELTQIGRGDNEPAGKFSAQDRAAARYLGSHRELYREVATIKLDPKDKNNYTDTGLSLDTFQKYEASGMTVEGVVNYVANNPECNLFKSNKSMTVSDFEKIGNGTGDDYSPADRKIARFLALNPELIRMIDTKCGVKENGEVTKEDFKEFAGILAKSEQIKLDLKQAEEDRLKQEEYERRHAPPQE